MSAPARSPSRVLGCGKPACYQESGPDGNRACAPAPAHDGDWPAAGRLADLLAERGDIDELRARADAGDWSAASRLPGLLTRQGRVEEAERHALPAPCPPAGTNLVWPAASRGLPCTRSAQAPGGRPVYHQRSFAQHRPGGHLLSSRRCPGRGPGPRPGQSTGHSPPGRGASKSLMSSCRLPRARPVGCGWRASCSGMSEGYRGAFGGGYSWPGMGVLSVDRERARGAR